MLGEKQYTPSNRNAAGASPATIPPVSGVMLYKNGNQSANGMYLVIRANNFTLMADENRRIKNLRRRLAFARAGFRIVHFIDSDHHRGAQSFYEAGQVVWSVGCDLFRCTVCVR